MRARLMFGASLLVAMMLALMLFVLRSIDTAGQQAERLDAMRVLTESISELHRSANDSLLGVTMVLTAASDDERLAGRDLFVASHEEQEQAIERVRLESAAFERGDAGVATAVDNLAAALEVLHPASEQLQAAGDDALAVRIILQSDAAFGESAQGMQDAGRQLAEAVTARSDAIAEQSAGAAARSKLVVLVGTLLLGALSAGSIWALANRIARQVVGVVDGLSSTSGDLNQLGDELQKVAEATSDRSAVVAGAAGVVGASVREVAVAVEQLGCSIEEIARTASHARQVAARAVDEATETNETVARLGQSSAEIGEVVLLIASVAEQTNLLALNATIEAARAGDLGRGFAVVAAEVKELANQTSTATNEIAQRISAIQADTGRAVDAIGRIAETVSDVSSYQNTIAAAVEEQSSSVNEVARSMEHASSSTDQIIHGIEDVAEASKTTTDGLDRLVSALDRLAGSADALRQVTG